MLFFYFIHLSISKTMTDFERLAHLKAEQTHNLFGILDEKKQNQVTFTVIKHNFPFIKDISRYDRNTDGFIDEVEFLTLIREVWETKDKNYLKVKIKLDLYQ